jgi:hypothetical protein
LSASLQRQEQRPAATIRLIVANMPEGCLVTLHAWHGMSARLTSTYSTTAAATAAVCCVQPYRNQGAGTGVLKCLLCGPYFSCVA